MRERCEAMDAQMQRAQQQDETRERFKVLFEEKEAELLAFKRQAGVQAAGGVREAEYVADMRRELEILTRHCEEVGGCCLRWGGSG
jgi:hypothetical protein